MIPFLVGTTAYNAHVQHMVRSLSEGSALDAYVTGGADCFRNEWGRRSRRAVDRFLPRLGRQLRSRAIMSEVAPRAETRWRWELPRLMASRLGAVRLEDWCWEHGELELDEYCATRLSRSSAAGFLGVEHGALASLRAAKRLGKVAVVAFLSPHHRTREFWVDREYRALPELRSKARAAVDALAEARDARRDEEAAVADWIVTNSSFTSRSLVEAGCDPAKMVTVPLGGPDPIDEWQLPAVQGPLRFIYVGPVSVRKGAHHLLRAWRDVSGMGIELHVYGKQMLPPAVVREAQAARGGGSIFFHGSVPAASLPALYQAASVLVLPTLCDGFGMVASEAMANGLPVITTRNAGAADAIDPGRSGFVIVPGDIEALTGTLQWCVDHPQELFGMRRPALAAASRRTWAHFRKDFREKLGTAIQPRSTAVVQRDRIQTAAR